MEVMNVAGTRKRKRFSKNKKKNWKKANTDDVEEFLEDKRLQERTGGLVAEKPNESLFFVDTSARKLKASEPVPRRVRALKHLRCHSFLEPDPNIKPVTGTRRCKKKVEPKAKKAKTQQQPSLPKKKSDFSELPLVTRDIWAEEDIDEKDEYYLRQTKKKTPQPPPHLNAKTSVLPSVEVPHPGASYNPLYEEYQDLLWKALETEEKKNKEELKLKRSIDDVIPKVTLGQIKDQWLKEMSSGINDADLSDSSDTVKDDNDRLSVNPPVRREDKKTEKQRRKEKERQAQAKLAELEKENKRRQRQIYNLKRLRLEAEQRLLALKKRQELKAARKEKLKTKPKKLGKHKYEEPDLEIKLSEELPDSLRHLKPEGHLLEDRYKSMQRRNIIEPRKYTRSKRRYKVKTYVKKSHKTAVNVIRNAVMK